MKTLTSNILRRTVFALTLAFVVQSAGAQEVIEVLHLKNGSMIKGMIIEQVPNESVKIRTSDGSVFVYPLSEVEKITKEVAVDASMNQEAHTTGLGQSNRDRSGFVNYTELCYGLGVGNFTGEITYYSSATNNYTAKNSADYIRLTTVNGFALADGMVSTGIGLGVEYYYESEDLQLPIFADIRLIPLSGISPMVIVQGGYSVSVSGNAGSGMELAGGIGLDLPISKSSSFIFTLLYDYQKYSVTNESGYYVSKNEYDGGSVRLSLGFAL